MKNALLLLLFALVRPGMTLAQCAGPTLATSYVSNNGQRGAMFDLSAATTVTIKCFDANLYVGTTSTYEIYYKVGSFVGSENTAADWTLVGQATNVTSLGSGVPTPLPIVVDVVIPAGQTYAFYVTNTVGGGLNYTTSTAPGDILASDASLTVTGGVGKAYPFAATFNYRQFNGTVHYRPGVALPVELTDFVAEADGPTAARLRWRTASEQHNAGFEVERSADGQHFAPLGWVAGHGSTGRPSTYAFADAAPGAGLRYYRLRQLDVDGTASYSPVRALRLGGTPLALRLYPNPARGEATATGLAPGSPVAVLDALGRPLATATADASGTARLGLPAGLAAGLYVVRSGGQVQRLAVE